MSLETPDKLHAVAQVVPVLAPPFTREFLSNVGFASFTKNSVGKYTLEFIDPLGFSEGYVRTDLGAGTLATAGAQILEDGSGVEVTVFDLAGAPFDPPFIGVAVVAVQQGEGAGPAVAPPVFPVGNAGSLPFSATLLVGGGPPVALTPGICQLYNTFLGAVVLVFPLPVPGTRVGAQGTTILGASPVSFDAAAIGGTLAQDIGSGGQSFALVPVVTMPFAAPDNTSTLRVDWEFSAAMGAWLPINLHTNVP